MPTAAIRRNKMAGPFFRTGLVSITFRKESPEALIELVSRAGQAGIEWGGDVHVPHGKIPRAEEVGSRTREAGLEVAAYGSYYRAGESTGNPDFQAVLDSALALKAPSIRVWAGKRGSADADETYRQLVKDDLARICALSADQNIGISLEFHGQTLTDTADSARDLLESLQCLNLNSLWQPPNGEPLETCLAGLEDMLPHISNVHVFHWGKGWNDRYPLAEGAERWKIYLSRLAGGVQPRWALMEFVKGDDPDQYLRDAAVLQDWVNPLSA